MLKMNSSYLKKKVSSDQLPMRIWTQAHRGEEHWWKQNKGNKDLLNKVKLRAEVSMYYYIISFKFLGKFSFNESNTNRGDISYDVAFATAVKVIL